ncbi:MAG: DNA replication complex GINS family protein [Nitrososphaerales archaeon]|nr:DNA replication complex GINS family protein [Nitrososphaerales archaeon]
MNESILNRIYALMELESRSDKLAKMPKNFYRDVAICMKKILNGANQNEKNIVSNLALEERGMIEKLIDRLIELRMRKASQLNDTENLTPEERYIMEPLSQLDRRRKRVGWAIKSGQPSRLDAIYDELASRLTMVRFLQPAPPIMGIDLRKYGPFEKEDIAIIPSENAKPLIKQNVVSEVWLDECNL